MIDSLEFLQSWFASNCDGDWEHGHGIVFQTLDNPGWGIDVELAGTDLEGLVRGVTEIERSESDWIHWWVEADKFRGRGGPENLLEIITVFRRLAEGGGPAV